MDEGQQSDGGETSVAWNRSGYSCEDAWLEQIVTHLRIMVMLALLFTSVAPAPVDASPSPSTAPATSEEFEATVRGSYVGAGKLQVTGRKIIFSIDVKDRSGTACVLRVRPLIVVNGRFKGFGEVNGQVLTIAGRLDAADAAGPVKTQRLMATFKTDSGEVGRVVAFVRLKDRDGGGRDPGKDGDEDDDDDDDEHDDRGKDRD